MYPALVRFESLETGRDIYVNPNEVVRIVQHVDGPGSTIWSSDGKFFRVEMHASRVAARLATKVIE